MEDVVKTGQYVIVQRQMFTKLCKLNDLETTVQLGRDTVELRNIADQQWFKTFKMQLKEGGGRKQKRVYVLEPADNMTDLKEILKSIDSGTDNRNINDDGQSQTLSNEEILSMRDNISDSKEIIGTLVANSKSFNEKTEFSQEKYIKKKEKKYFDFLQIRKPTIRLIADIFYRQDPDKPLGLRIDSLSQLISYSGVNSTGTYLLYDAGTSGLVPAAFLNSMGSTGDARLVYIHPGNFPQKQAIQALNLEDEHVKKFVSVNLYSVLRQFYQESSSNGVEIEMVKQDVDDTPEVVNAAEDSNDGRKRKADNIEKEDEPELKRQNIEDDQGTQPETKVKMPTKIPRWKLENEEAIGLMKQKVDSLIVVSKEDPFNVVKELLQFVHPGRPVVIFHTCKEVLMECFSSMKSLNNIVNLRLLTTWMRNYQVLPMRTHPAVQIIGTSGYLLVGYTINNA